MKGQLEVSGSRASGGRCWTIPSHSLLSCNVILYETLFTRPGQEMSQGQGGT